MFYLLLFLSILPAYPLYKLVSQLRYRQFALEFWPERGKSYTNFAVFAAFAGLGAVYADAAAERFSGPWWTLRNSDEPEQAFVAMAEAYPSFFAWCLEHLAAWGGQLLPVDLSPLLAAIFAIALLVLTIGLLMIVDLLRTTRSTVSCLAARLRVRRYKRLESQRDLEENERLEMIWASMDALSFLPRKRGASRFVTLRMLRALIRLPKLLFRRGLELAVIALAALFAVLVLPLVVIMGAAIVFLVVSLFGSLLVLGFLAQNVRVYRR